MTQNIPSNSIVAGNPGIVVGTRFSEPELSAHWAGLVKSGHRILIGREARVP